MDAPARSASSSFRFRISSALYANVFTRMAGVTTRRPYESMSGVLLFSLKNRFQRRLLKLVMRLLQKSTIDLGILVTGDHFFQATCGQCGVRSAFSTRSLEQLRQTGWALSAPPRVPQQLLRISSGVFPHPAGPSQGDRGQFLLQFVNDVIRRKKA